MIVATLDWAQYRYLGWALCACILWVGIMVGIVVEWRHPTKNNEVPWWAVVPAILFLPAIAAALIVGYVIAPQH